MQVNLLIEQVIHRDQYSRWDIVIMEGLVYRDGERTEELTASVVQVLTKITVNQLKLTDRDFVAVHRNKNQDEYILKLSRVFEIYGQG